MKNLLDRADNPCEKARLLSVQLPHAGDYLFVVPSPALGLQLRSPEFRTSILYRLGEPLFRSQGPCQACSQVSDRMGDHTISCACQGERIARHNHLRDAIYHTAVSANLAPLREERALLPGVEQRPADVLLPNYAGGKHLAVDVCVVSSLQSQMVNRAAEELGYAAQTRYAQKWAKYGDLCQAEGIAFQPMPIEVLGGFHEASARFVKGLGQALARSSGQERMRWCAICLADCQCSFNVATPN